MTLMTRMFKALKRKRYKYRMNSFTKRRRRGWGTEVYHSPSNEWLLWSSVLHDCCDSDGNAVSRSDVSKLDEAQDDLSRPRVRCYSDVESFSRSTRSAQNNDDSSVYHGSPSSSASYGSSYSDSSSSYSDSGSSSSSSGGGCD